MTYGEVRCFWPENDPHLVCLAVASLFFEAEKKVVLTPEELLKMGVLSKDSGEGLGNIESFHLQVKKEEPAHV